MKNEVIVLLLILLSSCSERSQMYVRVQSLPVYSKPGTGNTVLSNLRFNDQVEVFKKYTDNSSSGIIQYGDQFFKGGWIQIKFKNLQRGWVLQEALQYRKPYEFATNVFSEAIPREKRAQELVFFPPSGQESLQYNEYYALIRDKLGFRLEQVSRKMIRTNPEKYTLEGREIGEIILYFSVDKDIHTGYVSSADIINNIKYSREQFNYTFRWTDSQSSTTTYSFQKEMNVTVRKSYSNFQDTQLQLSLREPANKHYYFDSHWQSNVYEVEPVWAGDLDGDNQLDILLRVGKNQGTVRKDYFYLALSSVASPTSDSYHVPSCIVDTALTKVDLESPGMMTWYPEAPFYQDEPAMDQGIECTNVMKLHIRVNSQNYELNTREYTHLDSNTPLSSLGISSSNDYVQEVWGHEFRGKLVYVSLKNKKTGWVPEWALIRSDLLQKEDTKKYSYTAKTRDISLSGSKIAPGFGEFDESWFYPDSKKPTYAIIDDGDKLVIKKVKIEVKTESGYSSEVESHYTTVYVNPVGIEKNGVLLVINNAEMPTGSFNRFAAFEPFEKNDILRIKTKYEDKMIISDFEASSNREKYMKVLLVDREAHKIIKLMDSRSESLNFNINWIADINGDHIMDFQYTTSFSDVGAEGT